MVAIWFTGRMGKSTSRQVFGRFGSEKSTVSSATAAPAFTARATASATRLAFVVCAWRFAISVSSRSGQFQEGNRDLEQRQTAVRQRGVPARAPPLPADPARRRTGRAGYRAPRRWAGSICSATRRRTRIVRS